MFYLWVSFQMIFITLLIDKKMYILILIIILNIFFLVYLYYYQKKIILKMLFLAVVDNYTPISLFLSFSSFFQHLLYNYYNLWLLNFLRYTKFETQTQKKAKSRKLNSSHSVTCCSTQPRYK